MAAHPVKTQPLHNFSLPQLKWAHRLRRTESETATAPNNNDPTQSQPPPPQREPEEDGKNKPWKLRPRKVAIKATKSGKKETARKVLENAHDDCKCRDSATVKSQRKVSRKISISLSKEEVEEDVYALTGAKPSRRPRKWPKNVQKQLDNVFPGLYLVGVTADSYRSSMLWYVACFVLFVVRACFGIVLYCELTVCLFTAYRISKTLQLTV